MSDLKQDITIRFQPADLDEAALLSIRRLEAQLDEDVYLLAIKKPLLFALEAKTDTNLWLSIRDVYPQIRFAHLYFDEIEAKEAKAKLKSLLAGKWKNQLKKYPIRIRKVG